MISHSIGVQPEWFGKNQRGWEWEFVRMQAEQKTTEFCVYLCVLESGGRAVILIRGKFKKYQRDSVYVLKKNR